MAVEPKRGCGYRKVNALYLCGSGVSIACDRLPFPIEYCPVCGNGIQFSRAFQWLDWNKYAGRHHMQETEHLISAQVMCSCNLECSICWPEERPQPYGLLWVGEAYYTPKHFIKEAIEMGVSKKIPFIPKELKLGETVVLFAHKKAISYVESDQPGEFHPVEKPAIFYAFKPTTIEMLVYESELTEERKEELSKRGITPISIPDDDIDHSSGNITIALDPVTKKFSRVLLLEE